MHSVFTKMRPGVTLLALHGSMKQLKRVKTYEEFCRKQFVVLFATDLAARGLGKSVPRSAVGMGSYHNLMIFVISILVNPR